MSQCIVAFFAYLTRVIDWLISCSPEIPETPGQVWLQFLVCLLRLAIYAGVLASVVIALLSLAGHL